MEILVVFIVLVYGLAMLFILLYSVAQLHLLYRFHLFLKHKQDAPVPPESWPM